MRMMTDNGLNFEYEDAKIFQFLEYFILTKILFAHPAKTIQTGNPF